MMTRTINENLTFVLFDSLKDQPASLYAKGRQYEVMDAELGTTEADREKQLAQMDLFARSGLIAEWVEALHNYRLAIRLASVGYIPGQLEWACMIYTANGQKLPNYSEETLVRLIGEWSDLGLTQRDIESMREDVKKNS